MAASPSPCVSARGDHDAGVLLGCSLVSYFGWAIGTALGAASGQLAANPKVIGLDFIIIAFCAASAAMLAQTLRDYGPAISAVVAVAACEWVAPGPWTVGAAGMAAAVLTAIRYSPPGPAAWDGRE